MAHRCGGLMIGLMLAVAAPARAQEALPAPFRPADWTDVPDAFDGEDPFDMYLSIGYSRSAHTGKIRREVTGDVINAATGRPISGDGYIDFLDIAKYQETTNTLNLGVDIGVWH